MSLFLFDSQSQSLLNNQSRIFRSKLHVTSCLFLVNEFTNSLDNLSHCRNWFLSLLTSDKQCSSHTAGHFSKLVIFKYFERSGLFSLVFGQVMTWLMLHFTKVVEDSLAVLCLIVFLFLSTRGRLGQVLKHKKSGQLLSISCHSFLFPEDFGQVKPLLILDLTEVANLSLLFACPKIFVYLLDQCHQGELFKLKKNTYF